MDFNRLPLNPVARWVADYNHRKPIGMEPPGLFRRGCRHVAVFGHLAGLAKICCKRVQKIVLTDKIVAGVIGRVDVDQFHPPKIEFLEKIQNLKVLTFDKHMPRIVEIDALAPFGNRGRP